MAEPKTPKERQRAFRDRQKQGIQIVPAPVDQDTVELLLLAGVLDRKDAGDPVIIGEALVEMTRRGGA